jgi:hypothetical protein
MDGGCIIYHDRHHGSWDWSEELNGVRGFPTISFFPDLHPPTSLADFLHNNFVDCFNLLAAIFQLIKLHSNTQEYGWRHAVGQEKPPPHLLAIV